MSSSIAAILRRDCAVRAGVSLRPLWIGTALGLGLGLRVLMLELDNDRFSALAAGSVLAAVLYVCSGSLRFPLLSAPMLYLSVFALFHLGMAIPWALGLYEEKLPWWFVSSPLTPALGLVVLAMACYVAGAAWTARPGGGRPPDRVYTNPLLFSAGVVVYLAGCVMFFLGTRSFGAARFFDAGYVETYRLAAQFDPRLFGTSFTIVPIGLYLAASSSPRRWLPAVVAASLAWVLGIFYLGFRGFALIPGLVVLALLRQRGSQPPRWLSFGLLVLVLLAIPAARAVRDQAARHRSFAQAWTRIHPLDGVVEMGGSLRPLVHTLVYMDSEPWRWGKTYWQSLQTVWPNLARTWNPARYIPLEELPPNHWLTAQAEPDMYRHHGGLGFSAVAEPYMNFGIAGVVVYFFGLGAALSRAAHYSALRPLSLACWAMILGPLLWTTRNSFEIFFRPAVWGVAIAYSARLCSTFANRVIPRYRPRAFSSGALHARPHCQ